MSFLWRGLGFAFADVQVILGVGEGRQKNDLQPCKVMRAKREPSGKDDVSALSCGSGLLCARGFLSDGT